MKKPKKRTSIAKVVGAVLTDGGALWCVRLTAPYFPFYLDSSTKYRTLAEADAQAEKWRKRRVMVTVVK